jgi:hypothetical protein
MHVLIRAEHADSAAQTREDDERYATEVGAHVVQRVLAKRRVDLRLVHLSVRCAPGCDTETLIALETDVRARVRVIAIGRRKGLAEIRRDEDWLVESRRVVTDPRRNHDEASE